MQLTQAIQPSPQVVYHSIMGNINGTTDKLKAVMELCRIKVRI